MPDGQTEELICGRFATKIISLLVPRQFARAPRHDLAIFSKKIILGTKRDERQSLFGTLLPKPHRQDCQTISTYVTPPPPFGITEIARTA